VVDSEPIYVEGVTLVRVENGHYLLYLPDELAVGFRLSDEECSTMEAFVEYARRCGEGKGAARNDGEDRRSAETAGRPLGRGRPGRDPVEINEDHHGGPGRVRARSR